MTSPSSPQVYQSNSVNQQNYQQANVQAQFQQHHSRLIMRSNNGSHFVPSESTSLGNEYLVIISVLFIYASTVVGGGGVFKS